MIEKIKILELVNNALEGSDKFLVNLKITPDNRIYVDIDGDNGVTIDDCIELSRAIESQLDRDAEDFELNVSSAGADQPLKMTRQYRKNIGYEVEVLTADGRKLKGILADADESRIMQAWKHFKDNPPTKFPEIFGDGHAAEFMLKQMLLTIATK